MNKTSHIVTQRAYRVKPDASLGKSLEPGLQSKPYAPPPPLPHSKNKKMPLSQKTKVASKKKKRKNHNPTNNRIALLFVEIIFVLNGTVKLQLLVIFSNYFSRFIVELVVKR